MSAKNDVTKLELSKEIKDKIFDILEKEAQISSNFSDWADNVVEFPTDALLEIIDDLDSSANSSYLFICYDSYLTQAIEELKTKYS